MKTDSSFGNQEKFIADACQQSITRFPSLKGAKAVFVFQIPVGQVTDSELRKLRTTYDKHCILSKTNIAMPGGGSILDLVGTGRFGGIGASNAPDVEPPPLIEVLHVSNEVTIISYSFPADDAAIWIGQQLENSLLTTVRVQDTAKLAANVTLSWKCDHCGQLNSAEDKKCVNCGAIRQH